MPVELIQRHGVSVISCSFDTAWWHGQPNSWQATMSIGCGLLNLRPVVAAAMWVSGVQAGDRESEKRRRAQEGPRKTQNTRSPPVAPPVLPVFPVPVPPAPPALL